MSICRHGQDTEQRGQLGEPYPRCQVDRRSVLPQPSRGEEAGVGQKTGDPGPDSHMPLGRSAPFLRMQFPPHSRRQLDKGNPKATSGFYGQCQNH